MQKCKNKKKTDFEDIGATHFDITDDTANIACTLDCVKRKWGQDYIIVVALNLKTHPVLEVSQSCMDMHLAQALQ